MNGYLSALPSELIEATNGAIMALLVFVIGGFTAYIAEHWYSLRWRNEPLWSLRPLVLVYHERKAAIALLWAFAGFEVRTFAVWWPRHLANEGIDPLTVIPARLPAILVVVGTAMAIIGCACWLRVTLPLRIVQWSVTVRGRRFCTGQAIWFVIAVLCAAWGSWMALS